MYIPLGLLSLFLTSTSSQGFHPTGIACEFTHDCRNEIFQTDTSTVCVLGECYMLPGQIFGRYQQPENITARECWTSDDCKNNFDKCRYKQCKCQEFRGSGICEWECDRDSDCYTKTYLDKNTFYCAGQSNGYCRCQEYMCEFEDYRRPPFPTYATTTVTTTATAYTTTAYTYATSTINPRIIEFTAGVAYDTVEGKFYSCSTEVADWISAKRACENDGMTLAMPRTLASLNTARTACGFPEIQNRNKNDWWHPFADPKKTSADLDTMLQSYFFWIGGSAAGYGSRYKYVDGTEVPVALYLPGQYRAVAEETMFGAQNCLMGNVGLDNNNCFRKVHFVCEEEITGIVGRSVNGGRQQGGGRRQGGGRQQGEGQQWGRGRKRGGGGQRGRGPKRG